MNISRRFDESKLYLEVDGQEYCISELLQISQVPVRIVKQLARHPATFGYWGGVLAEADRQDRSAREDVKLAESDLKNAEADAYIRIKNNASYEINGKAPTDEGVKALIQLEAAVKEAQDEVQEARERASLTATNSQTVKAVVEALRIRGEMLQSVNANLREEYRRYTPGGATEN